MKIPLRTSFLPKFPRNPLFNRQTYETVFALLQCHPCYILQLINEGYFRNRLEFVRFVKAVFDPVATLNNKRSIHLLTCLANDLTKLDLPCIDIMEMHKAIHQTFFYPVFRLIFKSQKCNNTCIRIYVKFIIETLCKQCSEALRKTSTRAANVNATDDEDEAAPEEKVDKVQEEEKKDEEEEDKEKSSYYKFNLGKGKRIHGAEPAAERAADKSA